MADSSSIANTFQIPIISPLISIKLIWRNQLSSMDFIPILQSDELLSIVDRSELCPSKHTITSEDKHIVNLAYVL